MLMSYGLYGPGFKVGVGNGVSLLDPRPDLSWGARPTSFTMVTGALSWGNSGRSGS